jgi:hypothetical protein
MSSNFLPIVLAAVAAWLAGAVWYGILGRAWMAALGTTRDAMAVKGARAYLPFVLAFAAELAMAWMLTGLLRHLAPSFPISVKNGVIAAAHLWVAFVLTVLAVNYSFARRDWRLLLIDGGHWLLAMVLMGAILGAML